MALDKLVDSSQLDGALTSTANSLRTKTGNEDLITWDIDDGFSDFIDAIPEQEETVFSPISGYKAIETPAEVMTFTDAEDDAPMSTAVGINPVQDLHGQDSSYPAGGGKNLWKPCDTQTKNGVVITLTDDGAINLNGLCSGAVNVETQVSLVAGDYYIKDFSTGTFPDNASARYDIVVGGSVAWKITNAGQVTQGTLSNDATVTMRIRLDNGFNYQNVEVRPMFIAGTTAPTAFAPYSNICPISGWTGCNVTRTGKNLYSDTLAQGSIRTANGTTSSNQTRVRTVNGTVLKAGTYTVSCVGADKGNCFYYTPSGTYKGCLDSSQMRTLPYSFTITESTLCKFIFALTNDGNLAPSDVTNIQVEIGTSASTYETYGDKNLHNKSTDTTGYYIAYNGTITENESFSYSALIPVEVGKTYIFSGVNARNGADSKRLHGYNSSGEWVEHIGYVSASALKPYSLVETIESGIAYVRISYRTADTDVKFAKYNEYEITFPNEAGTVYGGTLTINEDGSGSLSVDMVAVDIGNLTWTKHATVASVATTHVTDYAKFINKQTAVNGVCSIYKVIPQTHTDPNAIGISFNTNNHVYIWDPNISELDGSGVSTYLAGQKLVYELATPVIYNLTNMPEITTLLGMNNVWANTGNIKSVVYVSTENVEIIDSGAITTGKQYLARVLTKNLSLKNIKDGITVKIGDATNDGSISSVTGAFTDSSTVSPGQIAADAAKIRSGYSAWVDGEEVQGTMEAATFANSATSGHTYVDISDTTSAPVLVSGGYLFINKGYTDDVKISLAKLVPWA